MKKLVTLTAIITFVAIRILCVIVYFSLAYISPITIAKLYDQVGSVERSIKYYEKQYVKTESLSDLALLCEKLDVYSHSKLSAKYITILVENEGFDAFCDKEDSLTLSGAIRTADYFYGKLVIALTLEKDIDKSITFAKDCVVKYGYSQYSPFGTLISDEKIELSFDDLTKIKTEIISLITNLTQDEAVFAYIDLGDLDTLLNG